jgi:hypothetical protein
MEENRRGCEDVGEVQRQLIYEAHDVKSRKPDYVFPLDGGLGKRNRDAKAGELRGQGRRVLCSRYPHGWDHENDTPVEYLLFVKQDDDIGR